MVPEKIVLKDGRTTIVRSLNSRDKASALRNYINALIREKAFFLLEKPVSLKEEKKWLKIFSLIFIFFVK